MAGRHGGTKHKDKIARIARHRKAQRDREQHERDVEQILEQQDKYFKLLGKDK